MDGTRLTVANEHADRTMWMVLRVIVACLLFVAAAAKIIDLITILQGSGLLSSRPRLFAAIAIEGAIATFLLIGDAHSSWRLCVATFAVFTSAAVYAVATGQDCNCIAPNISPRHILLIDVTVLALTIWFRPPNTTAPLIPRMLMAVCLCAVVAGVFTGAALLREQSVDTADPLEFLIADMIVDKPWPLDSSLHPQLESLHNGKWMVIVVRRDCEHCEKLISEFFAAADRHRPDERTAVFGAGESNWPFQFDNVSMNIGGDTFLEWPGSEPFVASPAIFVLQDGHVVKAADGEDADQFCRSLLPE